MVVRIYVKASLPIRLTLPDPAHPARPLHVRKSILYVYISFPALQIDSSVPFS